MLFSAPLRGEAPWAPSLCEIDVMFVQSKASTAHISLPEMSIVAMCEAILHNVGLPPILIQQRFLLAICHANPLAPSCPPCRTAWTGGPVAGVPASCLRSGTPDVQNTEDLSGGL